MAKIRARHRGSKRIYIHNDLSNAAYHFKTEIERKNSEGAREGIYFDYMACLVMLAFALEAKINFIGYKLFDGEWRERSPYFDKVEAIFDRLSIVFDEQTRPYCTVRFLKKFRDLIAHGKPDEVDFDEEIIREEEKMDRINDLTGQWEHYCTQEIVLRAYEDVDLIWTELLDAAHLTVGDASTYGESCLTYIETIIED